jgi:hypothetical protein
MNLLALWTRLSALPQGDRLFSFVFGQKAPYFSTIRPLVREVRPNHVEVLIKKRRRVHNHIKTVHVIAICNGLDGGVLSREGGHRHPVLRRDRRRAVDSR